MAARQRAPDPAARVDGSRPYTEVDLRGPVALVLGSEADGLTDAWSGPDIEAVALPMHGVADSLNVSVAAAVLLYEARRQRGDRRRRVGTGDQLSKTIRPSMAGEHGPGVPQRAAGATGSASAAAGIAVKSACAPMPRWPRSGSPATSAGPRVAARSASASEIASSGPNGAESGPG